MSVRNSKALFFSSVSALIKGDFNPNFTCHQILREANFGLGTFEALEGELIIAKGKAYQLVKNTNINQCTYNSKIAFAIACKHDYKGLGYNFKNINKENLEKKLIEIFKTKNLVQAIYGQGVIRKIHSRTVAKQEKPYKTLDQIIRSQSELEMEGNCEIELVGFYTPEFFARFGIKGFHWHFISKDRNFGGHIFEMELESINLLIKPLNEVVYYSPDSPEFLGLDLSKKDYDETVEKIRKSWPV